MKNLTPYLKALKAFETAAMTALIAALRVGGGLGRYGRNPAKGYCFY